MGLQRKIAVFNLLNRLRRLKLLLSFCVINGRLSLWLGHCDRVWVEVDSVDIDHYIAVLGCLVGVKPVSI